MRTYQVLGLIGSVLLLVGLFISLSIYALYGYGYRYGYGWGMMGIHMYGWGFGPYGGGFGPMFFAFWLMVFPALALGLAGSVVPDRVVGGVLLIIASILSLPVFFGVFGVSFVLLLLAGIMALVRGQSAPNSAKS
ncbi:MAG: hypothetical protein QW514_07155 [Thermoprotei archaeon]